MFSFYLPASFHLSISYVLLCFLVFISYSNILSHFSCSSAFTSTSIMFSSICRIFFQVDSNVSEDLSASIFRINWNQRGPSKRWHPTEKLHGVTNQKTSIWIFNAAKPQISHVFFRFLHIIFSFFPFLGFFLCRSLHHYLRHFMLVAIKGICIKIT
jgi:hypothetical protein